MSTKVKKIKTEDWTEVVHTHSQEGHFGNGYKELLPSLIVIGVKGKIINGNKGNP